MRLEQDQTNFNPKDEYAVSFPKFEWLSVQQRQALNDNAPFYITGPAGCGKSIVVLWKHINNIKSNKKSVILTYNVMLREFMKHCVLKTEGIPANSSHEILSLYKELREKPYWKIDNERNIKYCGYNPMCKNNPDQSGFCWCESKFQKYHENTYEIIIDEAQDFDVRALEILARNIRYICISADFDQQMYGGRIQNENTLLNLLGYFGKQINLHHLKEIFRYPLGIYNFVVSVVGKGRDRETLEYIEAKAQNDSLNNKLPLICDKIPEDREIEYLIKLLDVQRYKGTNVAILVPYSIRDRIKHNGIYQMDNNGNYIFNKQHKSAFCSVEYYVRELKERGAQCTFYINESDCKVTGLEYNESDFSKLHICSFKSAKGLEFDTVIIPKFEFIDVASNNQLKEYYVAMTRAKINLILLTKLDANDIIKLKNIDSRIYNKTTYEEKSYNETDF